VNAIIGFELVPSLLAGGVLFSVVQQSLHDCVLDLVVLLSCRIKRKATLLHRLRLSKVAAAAGDL
jgi:hypothetical protein